MIHNHTRRKASQRRKQSGFTLVEVMIVVGIMVTLASIGIVAIPNALRTSRVASVVGAVDQLRTAATNYIQKSGSLGTLPLTDGTIPAGQFTGTGTTSANVAAAGSLDQILLTEGIIEKPLSLSMGPQNASVTGTQVTWSVANNQFSAASAPTANKSGISRFECQLSSPATTPSTALGANFYLDGTNALPANVRVAYLVVPNVPAEDAYQLSLKIDKTALSQADNTTADNNGQVVYAAPVAGVTTVYVYVTQF